METAAKRFARRVLLLHLLLLAIVLSGVVVASKEIYDRSRDRVIEQASLRQTLLANQTARGIQNYYESILENLDLLHRAEGEEPTTAHSEPPPPSFPASRPTRAGAIYPGSLRSPLSPQERNLLTNRIYEVLWRQLRGRITLLFFYDRVAAQRHLPALHVIGEEELAGPAQAVLAANLPLIDSVTVPTISAFQFSAVSGSGENLLCIPYPRDRVLVAVVPVAPVQTTFVRSLNDDPDEGSAWLADGKLTVMAGSPQQVIGRMIGSTAGAMPWQSQTGTQLTPGGFTVGTVSFAPALLTTQALNIADQRWVFFVSQPLAQIEGAVAKLLNRALLWAAFVVLSVTAVLGSTAWQLIRSRVRLERIRHDLLTKEMAQARQIQLAWLPVQPPVIPASNGCDLRVDLAAINTPASHISGDFYNWFPLPDGKLVVTIGDVTGHGMSAAFLMATTQLLVRNTMPRVLDPAACLTEVNQQLCVQGFNGQFVTMLICVLDLARCELRLATAGHPSPLVGSAAEPLFRSLAVEPQLVLGVDRTTVFGSQHFPISPDTQLLLYTDGVVECANAAGDRFGADRLRRGWSPPPPTAQALLDGVLARVDTFRGPRELSDDLTLVSLRLCPASQQ